MVKIFGKLPKTCLDFFKYYMKLWRTVSVGSNFCTGLGSNRGRTGQNQSTYPLPWQVRCAGSSTKLYKKKQLKYYQPLPTDQAGQAIKISWDYPFYPKASLDNSLLFSFYTHMISFVFSF